MTTPIVRLLVVSDLHCHAYDTQPAESFLKAGAPRLPEVQHPVSALVKLLEKDGHTVDAVLAAGDLCDKMSKVGLSHAWHELLDVMRSVGAKQVVAAVGNHDIDSRKTHGPNPYESIHFLDARYPVEDQSARSELLLSGAGVVRLADDCDVVVINSAIDHCDEKTAKRGTFNQNRIDQLAAMLEKQPARRIRVGLLHHHPVLHSAPGLTCEDVLETGDSLLAALAKGGCRFVVHGHKHNPRLTYAPAGHVSSLPVLATGSFSAILREIASNTRNVFHIVEITVPGKPNEDLRGRVFTWEWHLGTGWRPATPISAGLPHVAGFGSRVAPPVIGATLTSYADAHRSEYQFGEPELLEAAPDLPFLVPSDMEALKSELSANGLQLDLEGTTLVMGRKYSGRQR